MLDIPVVPTLAGWAAASRNAQRADLPSASVARCTRVTAGPGVATRTTLSRISPQAGVVDSIDLGNIDASTDDDVYAIDIAAVTTAPAATPGPPGPTRPTPAARLFVI